MRLVEGDPTFYGAVVVSKGTEHGLVCTDGFDGNDAGMCQNKTQKYRFSKCLLRHDVVRVLCRSVC